MNSEAALAGQKTGQLATQPGEMERVSLSGFWQASRCFPCRYSRMASHDRTAARPCQAADGGTDDMVGRVAGAATRAFMERSAPRRPKTVVERGGTESSAWIQETPGSGPGMLLGPQSFGALDGQPIPGAQIGFDVMVSSARVAAYRQAWAAARRMATCGGGGIRKIHRFPSFSICQRRQYLWNGAKGESAFLRRGGCQIEWVARGLAHRRRYGPEL